MRRLLSIFLAAWILLLPVSHAAFFGPGSFGNGFFRSGTEEAFDLDTVGEATAAYSLRQLRAEYAGNAIKVRHSMDDAELDIGFADGVLDTDALDNFVGISAPLDTVTGAAAAYSLRRVRTAYAGEAIRVRRSSDNTESDISFETDGDLDEGELLAFCGAGSCFVTTWYDQSGNGYNVTQSTANNQPRIVSSGVLDASSGKPQMVFDGSNDYLGFSGAGLSLMQNISGFSAFIKWKPTGTGATNKTALMFSINSSGSSSRLSIRKGTSNNIEMVGRRLDANSTVTITGTSTPSSDLQTSSIVDYTNTDIFSYENAALGASNTSFQTTGSTENLASAGASIGADGMGSNRYDGAISEIIIYQSALSSANRKIVEKSQARYFAISGLSDAFVTTWYDQSGNARNATQSTKANQPRIVDDGTIETLSNGSPALKIISGSTTYLTSSFALSQPITELVVAKRDGAIGGSAEVLTGGENYTASISTKDTSGYFEGYSGANLVSSTVVPQVTYATTYVFNGASSKIYKDGAEIASGDMGSNGIESPFEIGSWAGAQNGGNYKVAEVILYGSVLSTEDREYIEASQMGHFEIALLDFYDLWGSHWFQPIPGGASYSSFQVSGDTTPGLSAEFYDYDINYEVEATNSDALETLYVPGAWDDRDSGNVSQGSIHVPNDFVLADATTEPLSTPNNPTIILNTTTGAASFLNACARPSAGGDIWGYQSTPNMTHNGSGTIGGQVNQSELDAGVINHAIGLNVWGEKYLSMTDGGYVSPAIKADSNFYDSGSSEYYGGNVTNLKMGSRLAIPPEVTADSLGITSPDALAVFNAAKTYGFFIVDNTAGDAISIHTDTDAAVSLEAVESELIAIYQALEIVE